MGVDISTYRCRVGRFVPHHGTGVICLPMSFSQWIKIIGAVSFVSILLLMAGIEQNPGPQDKLNFRYQYLLIEIGSKVLREIFDGIVGHDFVTYLANNSTASKTLTSLMTGKNRKLTADQEKLLPPLEKHPKSSMYDITLLTCLLRNVCGLSPAGDQVWMNPTDQSIEADITRLRKCRNVLMHTDTLHLSETELNDKWKELEQILTRLNSKAGIGNLATLISDAKHMDIDKELKERYLETMKAWVLMDCELDKVQEELKRCQSEIVNVQTDVDGLKLCHSVMDTRLGAVEIHQNVYEKKHCDLKGIQQKLVDIYRHDCSTLQVLPLLEDQDEDLVKIYQYPTMHCVPYHREEKQQKDKEVTSYQDIFCKGGKSCRNIYITGDAGTGKTSFCKRMCLAWCNAKGGSTLETESYSLWNRFASTLAIVRDFFSLERVLQNDIEYMKKFDCLFYVSLRDTSHYNVINMIEEQLLYDYKEKYTLDIDSILTNNKCIVLMDALDEWSPDIVGHNTPKLPQRNHSEKCVHITTCRPYKVENVRLSHKDIDHHVQISGIQGFSSSAYVAKVINYMNKENEKDKNPDDFMTEIKACGLKDQLCIPMLSAHLVMTWYETRLTGMTRAIIFANSLEMLFERAERRGIEFPSSPSSEFQLPECLSQLKYFNKHLSLLYKVGVLSFKSLFKQDDNVSSLVFTSEQLQSEPFHLSEDEQHFLCQIGVLSKNKVIGCSSRQMIKLSFFHKCYLEFFGALFISVNNVLNNDMKWSSLNEFIGFENFILLLAGLSVKHVESVFGKICSLRSDDLSSNAIFHYDITRYSNFYQEQIQSLQNVVIKCFKEVSRSNGPNIVLKLEDFIFESSSSVDILKQLLLVNTTNVKSIHSVEGKYYDEFEQIKNLQCLHVGRVSSDDYVKFTECMLQNQSTLHTVCIEDSIWTHTLIPELPVRSLQHLISLSLSRVRMQHNSLHNLVNFLSNNVLIENIKLYKVSCDNHQDGGRDCTLTLNLPDHTKLTSLYLWQVNILCNNVNNSSLKSITLDPLSESIVSCCIDLFKCIKYSQIESLDINGYNGLDNNTMKQMICAVKTLPCIKLLTLWDMKLPDDVLLQLHPDAKQVEIKLFHVTMSSECFIEGFVNNKFLIEVRLYKCKITSVDGETHRELTEEKSMDYMSEYLTPIPTVNITCKDGGWLDFETRSCQ